MSFPKFFETATVAQNLIIYVLVAIILFLSTGIFHTLQMRGANRAYEKGCNPTTLNESAWIECMKN